MNREWGLETGEKGVGKKPQFRTLQLRLHIGLIAAFPTSELSAQVQGVIPLTQEKSLGVILEFLSLSAPPAIPFTLKSFLLNCQPESAQKKIDPSRSSPHTFVAVYKANMESEISSITETKSGSLFGIGPNFAKSPIT